MTLQHERQSDPRARLTLKELCAELQCGKTWLTEALRYGRAHHQLPPWRPTLLEFMDFWRANPGFKSVSGARRKYLATLTRKLKTKRRTKSDPAAVEIAEANW